MTPVEQMTGDSNEIEDPVSIATKMKWRDSARRGPSSSAVSATETSPPNGYDGMITYQRTRRPLKGGSLPPRSILTPCSVTTVAMQQVPSPHLPPNVCTNPQPQSPQSPVHAAVLTSPASGHASGQGPLANKYPLLPSHKPPRPQRVHCSPRVASSQGVKLSLPSEFSSPSALGRKSPAKQNGSSYRKSSVTPNQAIPSPLDTNIQTLLSLRRNPSARGHMSTSSANHLSYSPSRSGPQVIPSENTELASGVHQGNCGGTATPEQKRRTEHKRKLRQLQTQVCKKLKTWGLESHLLQDVDGDEANSNDLKRLVMSESQRDAFVKNMVESCVRDPQMRATFLDAVKQLADVGVLQTSACHLLAQGPCDASQGVVKAWKNLMSQPQENATPVELYKTVDVLHKQGEMAMQKLLRSEDTSMCSLINTSHGAWEIDIPDPRKRASKGKLK